MSPITAAVLADYERDGVVVLRQVFEQHWVDELLKGLERNVEEPGAMSRFYAQDRDPDWFFYDTLNWSRITEYERFLFDSPAALIAGELMRAHEVRLLNDIIFYRGSGTQLTTPFHQDLQYLCFDTPQFVSLWMPLVMVEKSSALAFVPGSHRWKGSYARPPFSELDSHNPDGSKGDFEPVPEIAGDPDSFDVLAWNMAPGDCVMFAGRTMHGGSEKLDPERELKVFGANWIGERTRFAAKPGG